MTVKPRLTPSVFSVGNGALWAYAHYPEKRISVPATSFGAPDAADGGNDIGSESLPLQV
jgi:hypothetical protein